MALFDIFKKKKTTKNIEKNNNIPKESLEVVSKKEEPKEKATVAEVKNETVTSEKAKETVATKEAESIGNTAKNAATESKKTSKTEDKSKAETKDKKQSVAKSEAKTNTDNTPKPDSKDTSKVKATEAAKDLITDDEKASENKIEISPTNDSNVITGKFEINRAKDGKKYFFNLFATNQIGIASSQMYSTSQSALNGVKSVIANAPKAPIEDQTLKTYETLPYPKWEIYLDQGGKYRFRLNASNGNCVCHSQGYTTKNACKNGIDSIIRSSKNAIIQKTYISSKDED